MPLGYDVDGGSLAVYEAQKDEDITQTEFNDAKSIMRESKIKGTPTNILGKHLKDITNDIEQYKKETERLAEAGVKEAKEIVDKLTDVVNKEFTYEWLEKNDPLNLVLGLFCNCCASLAGVGYGIMRSSIIHPGVQNLIVRDKNGIPVAKATIYVNREQGYAVINNFEVAHNMRGHHEEIYNEFMQGIEVFAEAYNEQNPDKPLKKINVGIHLNDLEEQVKRGRKPSEILQGLDFSKYGKDNKRYAGDWSKGDQYTLWENKKNK